MRRAILRLPASGRQHLSAQRRREFKRFLARVTGVEPVQTFPPGANQHESYWVFDICYNNTSDIVPATITGDMHSVNKANFAILHWFGRRFEPRFTDIVHWGEPERGGHFAAWEQPELFVAEVRAMASGARVRRTSGPTIPAAASSAHGCSDAGRRPTAISAPAVRPTPRTRSAAGTPSQTGLRAVLHHRMAGR